MYLTDPLSILESLPLRDSLPVEGFLLVSLLRVEVSWTLGLISNILDTGSLTEAEAFMMGVLYGFMVKLRSFTGRGGGEGVVKDSCPLTLDSLNPYSHKDPPPAAVPSSLPK